MKMSIFGMLFILVVLALGPLVYFNGGKEYLSELLFSRTPTKSSSIPELNKDVTYSPVTTDTKVKVYKWKDKNGIWQFGNAPPVGLAGVESMTLQPNMNIMKAIEVPEKGDVASNGPTGLISIGKGDTDDKKSKEDRGKDDGDIGISQESLDNPYAPESISELFKSSKNLQNFLNNRQQQQSE